jgi:hypothetical protein
VASGCRQGPCSKTEDPFPMARGPWSPGPASGPLRGSQDDDLRQNRAIRSFSGGVLILPAHAVANPAFGRHRPRNAPPALHRPCSWSATKLERVLNRPNGAVSPRIGRA